MEEKEKEGIVNDTVQKILNTLGFTNQEPPQENTEVKIEETINTTEEETAGMSEVEIAAYNKAKQKYAVTGLKERIKASGLPQVNIEILNDMIDANIPEEKINAYIAKLSEAKPAQPQVPNVITGGATISVKTPTKQTVSASDFGKMLHEKFGKKIYKGGI